METKASGRPTPSRHGQAGATTLAVTMIMLVIITAMVLFSTSVGYFEQRTTTNQNRARIAQRSAEYALSLAGATVTANPANINSTDTPKGGWLSGPPPTLANGP